MPYAKDTQVSEMQSRNEIEKLCYKYGAESFRLQTSQAGAVIEFYMASRYVRFKLRYPHEDEFRVGPGGNRRNKSQRETAMEKERRRRWRVLLLMLKGKFESIEDNSISSFEQEFLYNIITPDGRTVGEHVVPQVEQTYADGRVDLLRIEGGR